MAGEPELKQRAHGGRPQGALHLGSVAPDVAGHGEDGAGQRQHPRVKMAAVEVKTSVNGEVRRHGRAVN
ncbi:hypothetical protein E2562_012783 [Oryza meyeriana var. granulata]|uniref:Uncharacterized protein n=1 Tax=Oryza meyeriana var. granulata TaxID=110450 RepID=A0A6G1DIE7_9ORYZ|nr:hypothetical protein E2562_012783 [Oryza meyeriana var. granulata]